MRTRDVVVVRASAGGLSLARVTLGAGALSAGVAGAGVLGAGAPGAGTLGAEGGEIAEREDVAPGVRSRLAGRRAVLLVDDADRSIRHLVLPPLGERRLRKAAILQAEQRLPPIEGGHAIDLLSRRVGDVCCALVVGLRRRRLEGLVRSVREAGLRPAGFAVLPLAFGALGPARGMAILRLGEGAPSHIACRDGLAIGWSVGPERLAEEVLTPAPLPFQAPEAPIVGLRADAEILAAARAFERGSLLRFPELLDRDDREPASPRELAGAAAAVVLALACVGAAVIVPLRRLERRGDELRALAARQAETVRASERTMAEVARLAARTAEIRRRAEEKPLASRQVRAIAQVTPAGVRLAALSINDRGQVTLDCEASDPQAPVLFIDLLRDTPGLRTPTLEYYSDRGSFRVSCGGESLLPSPPRRADAAPKEPM